MNELKWLSIQRNRFEYRIESIRNSIKEVCTEEENDNTYMKKYRKKEREKYELEIVGNDEKMIRIENRIDALEKDSDLADKSNEIFMQKWRARESTEKGFLERWLAFGEMVSKDPSLLEQHPEAFSLLDQQKRVRDQEKYLQIQQYEDLSWFDKIGKDHGTGKQHAIKFAQLKDELSFFDKNNQIEKAIGKYIELLMNCYPHDSFVSSNLRSIVLHYVELKKFSIALKVLDKYQALFPDDDEILLLREDIQQSSNSNKDIHKLRAERFHAKLDLLKNTRSTLMIESNQEEYSEFLRGRALKLIDTYHGRFLTSYKEKVLSKPNITSWSNLGFAYLQKGLFEEAAHSFIKTTQLGTKNQELWIWGAGALVEAKKYQEAIDLYKQMLPIIDIRSSKLHFESFLFHVFYLFETIFIQNPKDSKTLLEIKEVYSLSRAKIENNTDLKHFLKILDICEESIDQNLKKTKKK